MEEINKFLKEFRTWESSELLLRLAQFILWAVFILFVTWLIRKSINKRVENNFMRYRARKITRLSGYIFIILAAIIIFTGKGQNLTVTVGVLSAAIAFALQEVILSIAGWFLIFGSNIYKPGDRIEINGIKGDVIDIGVMKTTLMEIGEWISSDNYSGRIVRISNAFVFKGAVRNYSTDFPFVWDELNLPIKYGSDIQLADKLILDCARATLIEYANFAREHWKEMVKKYLIEDANVEPTLSFKLTDNWIEFNLRYVVDFKKRRTTKHQLYTDISAAIKKTEGSVALASATYELTGIPELKVSLNPTNNKFI